MLTESTQIRESVVPAELMAASEEKAVSSPSSVKQVKPEADQPQVLEELLIEEVSIDGMCGVY